MLGFALMAVGGLICFISGIWLLVKAFQVSPVQGLLCLLVPFYALYFIIVNWAICQTPFLMNLGGVAVMVVGMFLAQGSMNAALK